jgi:group II intron reverse transcriptase/maturase
MESEEITPMHSGGSVLATKFDSITTRAKSTRKYRFTSLLNLVTNEEYLQECFWKLKRNKSPGIDNVTAEEYSKSLEGNIGRLTERIKKRQYYPQSVKRVYIPKPDGKKRGLGIPTVEDKVVQMGITRVLEAIYEEVEFMDVSFGFRPKKNCHQALREIDKAVMTKPVNSVVDLDIEKFFDNLDHKWLMKMLALRIADKGFLRLIGRFLRAGIMEEGKVYETDKGTPQGGVVSPMLANIYLHYALDLWFEKKFKKQLKGYVPS